MQEHTYYALKFINFDEDVNIFEFICIALVRFAPFKTVYHGTDNDASTKHAAGHSSNGFCYLYCDGLKLKNNVKR